MSSDTLFKKFPELRKYTTDQLRALTPEQFAAILKTVQNVETSLGNKLIVLQTQYESLQKQCEEVKITIQKEFGVVTIEELEALRDLKIEELAKLYESLE